MNKHLQKLITLISYLRLLFEPQSRRTVLIILLLFTSTAPAQDLFIIPNAFFSSRNFEYSFINTGVSGHINSLGGGVTGIYQHFYVDLSGERSLSANESITSGWANHIEFERTDFAASFGYAVNESISAFVGYKYGKSTLTELPPSPFVGAKTSLDGQGLFIGAGGGWAVKTWGTFSFSAAYARMTANYKNYIIGTTQGDASGTSLSIKWKGPIMKNLYYDLSLTRHGYYYEDFPALDFDISEQILSFRVRMSYQF